MLGRVAGQRQTHGAVIPAGSRQISSCYKHSRRGGNFILKDAFSVKEGMCLLQCEVDLCWSCCALFLKAVGFSSLLETLLVHLIRLPWRAMDGDVLVGSQLFPLSCVHGCLGRCVSACAIVGAAGLSCQSEDLHPNLLGVCQPTTASEVFAVMVLKTSLSCVNIVPAPAGSCKEPMWRFSAFSSFFISAGSCCFVVT